MLGWNGAPAKRSHIAEALHASEHKPIWQRRLAMLRPPCATPDEANDPGGRPKLPEAHDCELDRQDMCERPSTGRLRERRWLEPKWPQTSAHALA